MLSSRCSCHEKMMCAFLLVWLVMRKSCVSKDRRRANYSLWWHRWRRRTRTVHFVCLWRTSSGSRSPSVRSCSARRIALGYTRTPRCIRPCLGIPESICGATSARSSPRISLFCSRTGWLTCLRTTCCCRSSRTGATIRAFGWLSRPLLEPIQINTQTFYY